MRLPKIFFARLSPFPRLYAIFLFFPQHFNVLFILEVF
jgi:hypothetical protein